MRFLCLVVWFAYVASAFACGGDSAQQDARASARQGIRFRDDVVPVRSVAEALGGVFIPPFVDCRDTTSGRVCTPVSIAGCTEAGRYFPDYASCEVVRTQRPFWPAPPAGESSFDDPRRRDAAFTRELAWVTEQVEASACTCCHDSRAVGGQAAQWDIRAEPIWLDTLSNSGLALFVGLADSSVLGAYSPEQNNGFQRDLTGIPSSDGLRMQAFLRAELARRGISEDEAARVPPFGGPIYASSVATPTQCDADEGVDEAGFVRWKGGPARYVYVTNVDARNPGVPPNLDLPQGTLWRLDVLASQPALASAIAYATTPPGSFQAFPADATAAPLAAGQAYRLYVLRDVGVPLSNCIFTFGDRASAKARAPSPEPTDAGDPRDASAEPMCDAAADRASFGVACQDAQTHRECGCAADYCAVQPGRTMGYCTATGCLQNPSICPAGWSCFDLGAFQPGAPSVCLSP